MAERFDPYHVWLGISPKEQPPDHYRLLAITRFESDPDVIEGAADRQMAHVRTFQTGKHSADSQRILNELSAAKLCLLDPAKRAAYEADLRRRIAAAQPVTAIPKARPLISARQAPSRASVADASDAPPIVVADSGPTSHARHRGRPRTGPAKSSWLALVAVAVPAAIFVGYLIYNKPVEQAAPQKSLPDGGGHVVDDRPPKPKPAPTPPDGKPKRFAFEIPDRRRARWSIEGDELVQSSLVPYMTMLFGEPSWQDLDFSVEVKQTQGNDACALLFRNRDDWNRGVFWAGSYGNRAQYIALHKEGREKRPASREASLQPGKWHRLELRLRGDRGRCYLDGEQIFSFDCEGHRPGRLGLATWSTAYRFRNIVAKTPDGKVLLEGLPDLDAEPPARAYEGGQEEALAARGGALPKSSDGRPLNFDFENGDLRDWTSEGDAFASQPVKGDILQARYRYLGSRHAGRFWVGGDERRRDSAKGTLTSVPFKVTHPYASFLIGGGHLGGDACLELLGRDGGAPFFRAAGHGVDSLQPVVVDLREHLGEEIVIRLADRDDRPWQHVNFDDFRFHETSTEIPGRHASRPSLAPGATVDVLKLVDLDRDIRSGQGFRDEHRSLVLSGDWLRLLELPVAVPDEYDLSLTVEGRPRVDDLLAILPIGDRQVRLIIDGWGRKWSALQLIDGKRANGGDPAQKTSTHEGPVLLDDQPNTLVCQVRANAIKVLCNGETVIDWSGDPKRLSLEWGKVAGWDGILVGGFGAGYCFSKIELTAVSPKPTGDALAAATPNSVTSDDGKQNAGDAKPRSLADLADGDATAQPRLKKRPPPDAASLAAAERRFDGLFGDKTRKSTTPDLRIALAREEVDWARWFQAETEARYVVARRALDLAETNGDAVTACRALELIAALYDNGDLAEARARSVERAFKAPLSEELAWRNSLLAMSVAEAAAEAGRTDLVKSLTRAAAEAARAKIKNQAVVQRLQSFNSRAAVCEQRRNAYQQALEALKEQPDVHAANLAAGRYEMLVLGDWKGGAERWTKLADRDVAELLRLDREAYHDGGARVAAARAWWEAASTAAKSWKSDYQLQAKYWCRRAQDAGVPLPNGAGAAWFSKALAVPGFPRARFRNGIAADLYNGAEFQELRAQRIDRGADNTFGLHEPDRKLGADFFSIRWTGWLKPPLAGTWRMVTETDDGVRLWIDGRKVLDFWQGGAQTQSIDLTLTDEWHSIRLDYYDIDWGAFAALSWGLVEQGEHGRQPVAPEALAYEPASPYDDPTRPAPPDTERPHIEVATKKSLAARVPLPRATANPIDFADLVGEVAPGFTTAPPVVREGISIVPEHFGRKGVLRTHPLDGGRPCVLTSTVDLPARKKTRLLVDVSHHEHGDWRLVIRANGKVLHDGPVDTATAPGGWLSLALDLTPFAGQQVVLELENHATGWYCEYGFWDRVQVTSK